jgi:DNA-binding transcriptional MerR regulator
MQKDSSKSKKALNGQPKYKIGYVADQVGLTVGTIRLYEARGLILVQRAPSGHRIFDDSDIERLKAIQRLIKEFGLNIEGICRLIALLPCWEVHHCLDEVVQECKAIRSSNEPCWIAHDSMCQPQDIQKCRSCEMYLSTLHVHEMKKILYPQLLQIEQSRADADNDK